MVGAPWPSIGRPPLLPGGVDLSSRGRLAQHDSAPYGSGGAGLNPSLLPPVQILVQQQNAVVVFSVSAFQQSLKGENGAA
ncbi:hypothetical protein EYF80_062141 [Liparis tanakae]|uniref:Uncharacterized protein n=1 Tax=Liparis tanakae TaxID=230148 RepID=A0A4Z2EG11_9TELE|nr:hypothetical protein EYF80_062141 [Liparis tanakae]